jgi:hypothetical protein
LDERERTTPKKERGPAEDQNRRHGSAEKPNERTIATGVARPCATIVAFVAAPTPARGCEWGHASFGVWSKRKRVSPEVCVPLHTWRKQAWTADARLFHVAFDDWDHVIGVVAVVDSVGHVTRRGASGEGVACKSSTWCDGNQLSIAISFELPSSGIGRRNRPKHFAPFGHGTHACDKATPATRRAGNMGL